MHGIGISYSQTRVTGKVLNANGEPVIGATIAVKNHTTASTMTDSKGNFSLTVPNGGKLLSTSFVGMKTVEVPVKSNLQVVMQEDAATLGEVAITAEFGMKRISRSMGSDASADYWF